MNPVRDLEIISEELRLKDLEYLNNRLVRGGKFGYNNLWWSTGIFATFTLHAILDIRYDQ